jgi:hypothetical protein
MAFAPAGELAHMAHSASVGESRTVGFGRGMQRVSDSKPVYLHCICRCNTDTMLV